MKAAFVVSKFPSVSQTFVLNQVTGLIERGVDVTVFAVPPGSEVPIHGEAQRAALRERVRYRASLPQNTVAEYLLRAGRLAVNAPRGALAPLFAGRSLREAVRSLPFHLDIASRPLPRSGELFDVVHAHFGPLGALAAVSAGIQGPRGPLVVSMHAYDITAFPKKFGPGIYRYLFREAHRILPISRHAGHLLADIGCPREKMTVHRMGIDTDRFPFEASVVEAGDRLRVVSVGRLVEKKGFEYGLRAVAALEGDVDVDYTVVGDGPRAERLASVAEELGIERRVEFTGWKAHEDVRELMAGADLLLVPSITARDGNEEGIPMVIMEAMALGVPVVTTSTGGIPELVSDDETGFLVRQRSPQALAAAVKSYYDRPIGAQREIARAARRAIEKKHALDDLNDRLVSLYEEIAEGGRSPATAKVGRG